MQDTRAEPAECAVLDALPLIVPFYAFVLSGCSNNLPWGNSVSNMNAPVELIVKLAPAAVEPGSPGHRAVQACVTRAGVSIKPLHQSTSESELATYFIAHVDPAKIEHIVEQLLACEGVDSAYAKPRGKPPG